MEEHFLEQRQSLPCPVKVLMTKERIRNFIRMCGGSNKVYVGFSGGKDSTVLANLVYEIDKTIPWVFSNTGLEYPEIVDFVNAEKEKGRPVVTIRPKLSFSRVVEKYGYPAVSKEQAQFISEYRNTKSQILRDIRMNGRVGKPGSKISKKWLPFLEDGAPIISHRCCDFLKKYPFSKYEKETGRRPILGLMACESELRKQQYAKNGCIFETSKGLRCTPMMFWNEEDVWESIRSLQIDYCKIYDNPEIERTGCIFCAFGCTDKKERWVKFLFLKKNHPKLFDYCWNKLGLKQIFRFIRDRVGMK